MRERCERECPRCDRITHHVIELEMDYDSECGKYRYGLTQVCGNCGLIRHSEPIKWGPWLVRKDTEYKEWVKEDGKED